MGARLHEEAAAMSDPIPFLRRLFDRAVAVADPMQSLHRALPERPEGRLVVVGAGKASARMAEAVQALEKAAGARSQAGAQGSEQETREAEDEVIRVLGLCARAAKLGTANARTAVDHALRAFETVRPASARALADASHAGTVWGSRRHVSWGSGRRRVTL